MIEISDLENEPKQKRLDWIFFFRLHSHSASGCTMTGSVGLFGRRTKFQTLNETHSLC